MRPRSIVFNVFPEFGISTVGEVQDSDKPFETAIKSQFYNKGSIIIVEEYDTEEQAVSGHKKWIERMNSRPELLMDVSTSVAAKMIRMLDKDSLNFKRVEGDTEGFLM